MYVLYTKPRHSRITGTERTGMQQPARTECRYSIGKYIYTLTIYIALKNEASFFNTFIINSIIIRLLLYILNTIIGGWFIS